jgi:hypothetical protein
MLKTAPYLVAGVTVTAALVGSVLLAAQDRDLFEPQHALLGGLLEIDDGPEDRRPALEMRRFLAPTASALRAEAPRGPLRPRPEPKH